MWKIEIFLLVAGIFFLNVPVVSAGDCENQCSEDLVTCLSDNQTIEGNQICYKSKNECWSSCSTPAPALDCSACNALSPEGVASCLEKCQEGGGTMPASGQPGSPSAGTSVGNFKNIGTKLGNVSKGFYGDMAPKPLEQMIGGYIKTGLALVGVIFLLLMVYGGYTWMIARGDETEAKKAKDTITMAAIGMAVVLIAYVITYFVLFYALQSVGQ